MDDINLYTQILGIKLPWKIKNVDLDVENQKVDIYIIYDSKTGICKDCEKECKIHDTLKPRTWRHLSSCQFKTFIHCSQPRIKCENHKIKALTPPWTTPNSRFTMLFESFAINVLLQTKCQKRAAQILNITDSEMYSIKQKSVKRGLETRQIDNISIIGMDEKSIENGHNYASIIKETVKEIFLSENRKNYSDFFLI